MAELSYPDHTPEIRMEIARLTCFLLHVDDLGKEFSSLENLQLNILLGDSTEGAFNEAFRKHLIGFYQFYDPIPANAITLSAMDCINGMLLEQRDAIRDIKLSDSARSWPNYLRNKTGCSEAYAFMLFPKAIKLDLKFYKEYLGGERDTYVFLRARIADKPLNETLRDVVSESLAAHARVSKALQHTCAISTWKQFVNGYLGFHFTLARYRLSELGF
uniref:Uncharacterized protein n=1 Tax=Psilocybe cubensis TaxID=181762 RepID=A0A8H7XUK1_PSICU